MNRTIIKNLLEKILSSEQYGHPPQTRPVATKQKMKGEWPDDDGDRFTMRDEDNKRDIEIIM
jgi:hypothetical protein